MEHDPFDLTGDVLDGQFRVDSFAGEGDLSVVYKGHHLGVDAPIAIKCLNLPATLDPSLARPLVDGFKEASRVHYKLARGNLNIAQSIASGTTLVPRSGAVVPYMVREWFDGESLASNLTRRRGERGSGRTIQEALALLETAFDGVAFAHQQGEMHLSINPSNLFLATNGDSATLKVLDFGIARTMNDIAIGGASGARAEGGLRVLFPTYAAPEQLDKSVGKPGPWTDVYALALVTMEVLSDRIVMAEQETGAIVEHALDPTRRPTPRAHGLKLPHNLDLVLTRAVMRAPARRHESAAALWRDIKSAVRPIVASPVHEARAAPAPPKVESPPDSLAQEASPRFDSVPTGILVRPQTLMGMGGAVAVGALGKRAALPSTPSVETKPMSFELHASPSGVDLGTGLALASVPVSTPSSVVDSVIDEPLFEPRPILAIARANADAMFRRLSPLRDRLRQRLQRYEPRTRVLIAIGVAVSAILLVVLVASHGWHHAAPSPAPIATVAAPALPPPPPEVEPPQPTPAPAPTKPFNAYAARRALDGTSRDILSCRRDKKWGVALATVTFANDGSVKEAVVGVPFRGTPTGECVADDLSAAHVAPFAGKEGVVVYQFFVPLK